MPVDEYDRITRRASEALQANELSDNELRAIAEAKVPQGYEDLDREIE